jgi:hypothetical protein
MTKTHRHLPYCIRRIDGKKYEVLNRNYEIYKTLAFNIDSAIARTLSCNGSADYDKIYLYANYLTPSIYDALRCESDDDIERVNKHYEDLRKEYKGKLQLLASLIIKDQGHSS